MASRLFENKVFHLEHGTMGLVQLFAKVTVTGDSTPADSTAEVVGNGFASASRTGTGEYTVVLSDVYSSAHACLVSLEAAASLTTGQALKLVSFTPSTKSLVVAFTTEAGVPEDLTDAEVAVVNVALFLDNSF
jgi:hypothetical protein